MENEELRRLWTYGKVAAIFERKTREKITRRQMMELIEGRWSPACVSTEELIEELRKDPFKPEKLRAVKRAVGPKVRRGQLTLSEG